MFKLIAYLMAIVSLYHKQLFMLFFSILIAMLLVPAVKKADPQRIMPVVAENGADVKLADAATGIGQEFISLAELKAAEMAAGFVATGAFGDSWPATVTEIILANDKVTFTRQNGTNHTYKGFGGYQLKVVRLISNKGKEVILVFRSKSKG